MIEIVNTSGESANRGIRMADMRSWEVGRVINDSDHEGHYVMRTDNYQDEVIDLTDPDSGSWTDLNDRENDTIRVVLLSPGEEIHLRLFNKETS